jgi:DnaA-homolog protein
VTAAPRQLALRFPPRRSCTLESFEAGANPELVARLAAADRSRFTVVWITGAAGAGKSHLLQAACEATARAGGTAAYLPADLAPVAATVLDGLDAMDRVALDDMAAWLGERSREAALLGLYQGLAQRNASLVVAADAGPRAIEFALPDLASRLRAAETLAIAPLDDGARRRLVQRIADSRGFTLADDALSYLLNTGPRGSGELVRALEALDAASLAAQRRVTVPLIRAVLRATA